MRDETAIRYRVAVVGCAALSTPKRLRQHAMNVFVVSEVYEYKSASVRFVRRC